MSPDLSIEQTLLARGYRVLAGIDEAGRGCWAGPVVAAAVVLAPIVYERPGLLDAVDDSKQLTAVARERAYTLVQRYARGIGVGTVPAFLVDAYGILPATRLAMTLALLSLPCSVDALLIDAERLPGIRVPQESLVRGDARSLSIAAASIIAKVTRDRLMQTADRCYPQYGFALHKGYGTPVHRRALRQYGPSPFHRRTFQPVLELLDVTDSS
ncbi:MAG: ribonuclease HII [Chloroflexus sp.]|uniref:ribonuclease HII n=1 Tax=Chloroflexus sp. TaxID=1904827 RepID=UPI000F165836|nr:ribonuclease HII [Chloroflexus sp.]RMD75337.1 MAG: ribonuclease HII [Chloroflexota bacterium]GIV91088.1 MAG: ribonuclease HII [Chloroflexus sp.]